MKKTILFLAIAAIVASCEPNEPKAFVIKDTDMISIRPAASAVNAPMKVKADDAHLSALEIVKKTTIISTPEFERSFIKEQRDTVSTPPKLLMWATDVITLNGDLQEDFITANDVVLVHYSTSSSDPNNVIDTIAYIPNSVLRAAETSIRAAYEAKDIEECYRLFNEAYTFTPITGAEWRTLKANGQN